MKKTLAVGLMLVSTSVFSVPNIHTPGAINPNVTQDNIHQTICVPNWTSTVRPPVSYTNKLKTKLLKTYGYKDLNPKDYELDHLLPLSSGGDPSSEDNLWPQPYHSGQVTALDKDTLEKYTHRAICSGKMTLKEAQSIYLGDWVDYYLKHIKH